jgi:hypothetical protein
MGNLQNISGAAGEYLCGMELLRPVPRRSFLFSPVLLGGKEPTFDYLVYLLDENGDRFGPFFFLQVKSTTGRVTKAGNYPLGLSAFNVRRAIASKVPFFVCIVDRSKPRQERFFILGVDSRRTTGIAQLVPRHDLATDEVKLELHGEVERLWALQGVPLLSKLI